MMNLSNNDVSNNFMKSIFFGSQAHISFSPTLDQQRKCPGCEGTIIEGDFIIKYDVKRKKGLGEVQVRSQQRLFSST